MFFNIFLYCHYLSSLSVMMFIKYTSIFNSSINHIGIINISMINIKSLIIRFIHFSLSALYLSIISKHSLTFSAVNQSSPPSERLSSTCSSISALILSSTSRSTYFCVTLDHLIIMFRNLHQYYHTFPPLYSQQLPTSMLVRNLNRICFPMSHLLAQNHGHS